MTKISLIISHKILVDSQCGSTYHSLHDQIATIIFHKTIFYA